MLAGQLGTEHERRPMSYTADSGGVVGDRQGDAPDPGTGNGTMLTWRIWCGECDWQTFHTGYAAAARAYQTWQGHVDATGHQLKQEKWT